MNDLERLVYSLECECGNYCVSITARWVGAWHILVRVNTDDAHRLATGISADLDAIYGFALCTVEELT
jgi:hypothetical protein